MSCMVIPWSAKKAGGRLDARKGGAQALRADGPNQFQLGKGPKWGSQSPLTSFARGSQGHRVQIAAKRQENQATC